MQLISDNPNVIGIRDTETVKDLQKRLSNAKRIIVVGNGGIATELVYTLLITFIQSFSHTSILISIKYWCRYEVNNVEVIWIVKHKSISATFVDAGAAEFFISHLNDSKPKTGGISKRLKYTHAGGVL